jgi:protocatechuate 3,4-dioxygenase beta subunit
LVRRGFVLAGHVVSSDGTACSSGDIQAKEVLLGSSHRGPISEGMFLLEAVPPGRYRFEIDCAGHIEAKPSLDVSVVDQDVTDLGFTVTLGFTISGLVLDDDDTPVTDTTIRIQEKGASDYDFVDYAFAGEDGAFQSSPLNPGNYVLRLGIGRFDDDAVQEPVTLGDASIEGIVLRVSRSAGLSGRVVDSQAEPVAGMSIEVERGRTTLALNLTDADGRFVEKALAPGSAAVLVSHPYGKITNRRGELVDRVESEVTLKARETADVEIDIGKLGAVLAGQVVDGAGGPVPFAKVIVGPATKDRPSGYVLARSKMFGSTHRWEMTTTEQGQFRFDSLVEQDYRIIAKAAKGDYGQITVAAPAENVELKIAAAGDISGIVMLSDDDVPPYFSIKVVETEQKFRREEVFRATEGEWEVGGLPSGKWSVVAETPEGSARANVVLSAGQHAENIVLRVERRSKVVGRVVDFDSEKPLQGVRVGLWMDDPGATGSVTGADENPTDELGRFEISGVPAGRFKLRIDEPKRYVEFRGMYGSVEQGSDVDVGEVRLRKKPPEDEKRGMLGFIVEWPPESEHATGLKVEQVRDASPAHMAGLQAGDMIVAVRGTSVAGADTYLFWQLVRASEGEKVALLLGDGRLLSLRAAPWGWESAP